MKIAYNPITAEALTTAPANNDITFDLRGLNIFVRGVKFKGTDTTYSVFKKHTSSSGGGYNGLVPVPSYTSTNVRFLREDGTWQVPFNQYTYSLLTNQDLDTLKTEGKWYYLGSNNTVTNGPSDISKGGELYVGRNASGYRYQKVILSDGLIWFRIWNSSSWSDWKRWYTDDSKVLQSNTTTANYRPIILGYNNNADHSNISTSVTLLVYTTTKIYAQPSTGSLWANMLYSQGKPVLVEHQSLLNYVTLNTAQTITGLKTFTSQINSTLNTATYLEGNRGKTIINSTAGAGSYVMLFKGNSTDGYFTHGIYLNKYLLQYTAKSTVDAGTNAVTKSVTLLDESGNSLFPGSVIAPKFIGPLQGNADSATKLLTARTIWGRPFDGTANVSGNLDNVGNLNAASNNSYLARNASDQSSGIPWHGIGIMLNENFFGNRGAAFVSGYFGVLLRAGGVSLKLDYDSKSIISSTKIRATGGFVKEGSSNSYVLLGGGGHKPLSDFASYNHTHNNYMTCDGTNSITLTGGNGNNAGWRLVIERVCGGGSINNIVFSIASRHTCQGVLSIGFHTTNSDATTYTHSINFKGSTASNSSGPWRAFYNTSTKKFRLYWYYNDYNDTRINVLARIGFNAPKNGTWYTSFPSDNGTELTIYYNNADTLDGLHSSNFMRAVNANGYYGMARPDGNTSDWIRTTSTGIIPYQSGGSTAGHCSIGTSSWYFSSAYILNMYGTLHGEASSSKYLSEVTYITNLDSPSWFDGGDSYGISLNSYNSPASNQPGGGDNANSVLNICNTKHGTSGVYGWQLAFENHQIFARKWLAGSKTSWRLFAFTDEVTSLIGNKIKWAYYRVDVNSTATYSLWAGNYGFITKIRRDDVGYAVLTISYPSGANYKNTIVLATGHHVESDWESVAYASILPDYSSGRMLKLLIADDSTRNNGTAMILFMYIS